MRIPDLALPSAAATLLSRSPATPPAWLLAASLNHWRAAACCRRKWNCWPAAASPSACWTPA